MDLEDLREKHTLERELGLKLTPPEYPPPYDDLSYDAGAQYWGNTEVWAHSPTFPLAPLSEYNNPFHEVNLEYAERLIIEYRQIVSYPEWSRRIGLYPVPESLNIRAYMIDESPYALLEEAVGSAILYDFGVVASLREVRAYTLAMLIQENHPVKALAGFKKRGIDNILAYIRGIARRAGYGDELGEDKGNYLKKVSTLPLDGVVRIVYPWRAVRPLWDVAGVVSVAMITLAEISPLETQDDWILNARTSTSFFKNKKVEDRKNTWGKKRTIDKNLLEPRETDE